MEYKEYMSMRVTNMANVRGDAVPNQFIIEDEGRGALGNFTRREVFQSYETIIARRIEWPDDPTTLELDRDKWDYSATTARYRNQFTGMSTAETKAGILDGSIKLVDLNR